MVNVEEFDQVQRAPDLLSPSQLADCGVLQVGTQMVYDYDELAALTRAARDGDVRAYGRIVELTRSSVEAAARVIVHNSEDAEDIAQETYVRAFGQLGDCRTLRRCWRGSSASLGIWR